MEKKYIQPETILIHMAITGEIAELAGSFFNEESDGQDAKKNLFDDPNLEEDNSDNMLMTLWE